MAQVGNNSFAEGFRVQNQYAANTGEKKKTSTTMSLLKDTIYATIDSLNQKPKKNSKNQQARRFNSSFASEDRIESSNNEETKNPSKLIY